MVHCEYPPPVPEGGTVAVVAPSHAPPDGALSRGVERLRSFGVDATVFDTATRDDAWLRANPSARAADVNRAFADDEVDGVVAAMGGNRAVQLLDDLDRSVIGANPKRFFGSSDNTHLHLFLNDLGAVSFYGGQLFPDLVVDQEVHPYTREYVGRALRATPFGRVEAAAEWTDEYYDLDGRRPRDWFPSDGWTWHNADGRTVRGTVVGGCFEMLESQLMLDADPFVGRLESGGVLAVETSGETPEAAEVERFFTVLGERGVLADLEAVLVGRPETPKGSLDDRTAYRRDQRETVARVVDEYHDDLPVVFDLDFGHTAPVLPLPLGAPVELDTAARTVSFPASR